MVCIHPVPAYVVLDLEIYEGLLGLSCSVLHGLMSNVQHTNLLGQHVHVNALSTGL